MNRSPLSGEEELRAADLAAALREATAWHAQLFERGLAGAFRCTPDGRILEVNPACARMMGFSTPEEMRDTSSEELFLEPMERQAFLEELARGGEPCSELRLRRRDGATLWVVIRARQRSGLDGVEVIEGTVLDVTAIKEGEAGLLQAGRLAAVGALAAGVAHEVNSPLAGILANLAFALEALPGLGVEDETAREVTAALEDARAAAERLRDIVRDLRLFARTDEGDRGPLSVSAVLEATLGLVANQLRHRARVVRVLGDAPQVVATASSLGQAFLNLLLDAAQAIPEGAASRHEIRVSLGRDPSGGALVEISHSGAGMTPEALARAFDPHRPRQPGGPAGMGLPVARAVIETLGGSVTLESEPGRGTTARVRLPPAPPPAGLSREAERAVRSRRRVLVIDDEPVVGKSLRRLLPEHEVLVTAGAAEALAVISADPDLDVVLCDLMMPEISGAELYRELAGRFPELARRVVFITGGAFTPETRAFLREVGNPVLEKPFDLRRLRSIVAGRSEGDAG
jgi:PAS domain S-box-containing protein